MIPLKNVVVKNAIGSGRESSDDVVETLLMSLLDCVSGATYT